MTTMVEKLMLRRVKRRPTSLAKTIVMTGPRLSTRGGIASTAKLLLGELGSETSFKISYVGVSSAKSKSSIIKAAYALSGYASFVTAIRERPILVHIHTTAGSDYLRNSFFLLFGKLSGAEVLLHVHTPWSVADYLASGRFLTRYWKKVSYRMANIVLVPGHTGARRIKEHDSSVSVAVVPNAVQLSKYCPTNMYYRHPSVLYLGWQISQKGVYDLIEAFAILAERDKSLRLALCGPYGTPEIGSRIAALGLQRQVFVSEWADQEEKVRLLGQARVLALPSYSEGYPLVVLEALASGLPCVAGAVGGVPELLEEGRTGFLINPGDIFALTDRLTRLLRDDHLWMTMHGNAMHAAKSHDASIAAARLRRIYLRHGS